MVGLGQSHLSQKIPATTTRCVYLDHLLSRAVNFAEVYYRVLYTARVILKDLYPSGLRRLKARFALTTRKCALSTDESTALLEQQRIISVA